LKGADFSSWSGSAWTVTPAYDLGGASYNGILYDAAGNLTALQRNRETGTVLDNLAYTISPTSNRLTQIGDAVDGTPEPWDAEDGAFTYDANGNLLTAPGAPYSISVSTPITYNHQNLPVSLTRSGITTTYRYDDAGQRVTKQVGGGNTEVYLREGATTLAVFTVDGAGAVVQAPSYFNVVWEDRVVGRQPLTATRVYYHNDILGSTRAVVLSTTGAVVESYDFEPWGLLMPGRTLGSGTKEGFSGKEQDPETGLDYFGARYYMPALGRWAEVDPSADATPAWSPYNYVLDNPATHMDPDGRQTELYNLGKAMLRLLGTGKSDVAAAARGTLSGLERVEASMASPPDPVMTSVETGVMGALAINGSPEPLKNAFTQPVQEELDRWNKGGIEGKADALTYVGLNLALAAAPLGEVNAARAGVGETTFLYQKVGAQGEHLKFGVTNNPATRYSRAQLAGGRLRLVAEGARSAMLKLERKLHETLPIGPEEKQAFYVDKQIEKGLKPPPYE
jgi:RHS repeat-associated protein